VVAVSLKGQNKDTQEPLGGDVCLLP
jgi:hypothetical protein